MCGAVGYCRHAIIDKYPIRAAPLPSISTHNDYSQHPFIPYCASPRLSQNLPISVLLFCRVHALADIQYRQLPENNGLTCPDAHVLNNMKTLHDWDVPEKMLNMKWGEE